MTSTTREGRPWPTGEDLTRTADHAGTAAGTRLVSEAIGADVIRSLHEENRCLDLAGFIGLWAGAIALAIGIGRWSFVPLVVGAIVLQGFVLQMIGFYAHDACLHRQIGGRLGPVGAALCFIPVTVSFTDYRNAHLVHHRYVNTAADSEEYKKDFDRRWVKLVLLTIVGTKMSWSGGFRRDDRPAWKPDFSDAERRRIRYENIGVVAWFVVIVALAVMFPRVVLLGYVVLLLVIAPIASSFRVILEHGDSDPSEPLRNSTYYRTGLVSGPLFLHDSGDCHLVHHLYPAIPFYRMRRAVRLMRPVLLDAGVREHRSMLRLLHLWFVANRPHGTPWTDTPSPASGSQPARSAPKGPCPRRRHPQGGDLSLPVRDRWRSW